MSILQQPVWLLEAEAPILPKDWRYMTTEDACDQLKPGKLFENKTVTETGSVPVINQSADSIIGFHDEEPGVNASQSAPVVTFANHTCAMRLMKEPFSCIQNIFPKVGKPGITDTRFFYYASLGRVSITDYKGHHPVFRKSLIPIPPLPTQRKIAGILSAYDDLIENNLRRIKILEQMAQSLYREWFVHFRFPRDPSEASAKAGGHESAIFKDSELGRIPEGWQVKKLGELADINAKSIRATNAPEEIHYIDIASVSTGAIDKIDTMTFDSAPSRARRVVRHGDIIWSTVRPNRRSFSLIIDPAENVIASTGFAVLSARSVPWSYLYQATTTDDFTSYLVNHASGAAYPAVNAGIFENADIVMPPSDLLKRFNAMAEPNQVLQQKLHRRNQTLRRTRDLLLPKLLSGG